MSWVLLCRNRSLGLLVRFRLNSFLFVSFCRVKALSRSLLFAVFLLNRWIRRLSPFVEPGTDSFALLHIRTFALALSFVFYVYVSSFEESNINVAVQDTEDDDGRVDMNPDYNVRIHCSFTCPCSRSNVMCCAQLLSTCSCVVCPIV